MSVPPGWEILFSSTGWNYLRELQNDLAAGKSLIELNLKLRKLSLQPEEIAALINQLELQQKGRKKFGTSSSKMLFTKAGLEQASRKIIADLHAQRFTEKTRNVADLGCGIGSQSISFLNAGINIKAVEIDYLTAKIAEHNLLSAKNELEQAKAEHSEMQHSVVQGDATNIQIPENYYVFFDPARRTLGHKNTSRVTSALYSPSLEFVFDKAAKHSGAVKLGPAFEHALIPKNVEAQWISHNGDLLENVLWFGDLKRDNVSRSALVIKNNTDKPMAAHDPGFTVHELNSAEPAPDSATTSICDYIYEPDGAVIRAQLIGQLAKMLSGGMIDQKIAYITSNSKIETPFAQGFKIISEAPTNVKQLAKFLKNLNVSTLEIKKRGVDVNPHELRKSLKLKGENSATIIMTRKNQKHVSYLVERI